MELRKDYILNRWVYIATDRAKRKHEFKQETSNGNESDKKSCFFCPGNEHTTPPEIGRVEENNNWELRWFPNKFPAVKPEGNPHIKTDNSFFTFASGFGHHEVIVEGNDHNIQLWDLPKERIKQVLEVYKQRIEELSKKENINYVIVFKNHGKSAGTSLVHTHTQVCAVAKVPENITEKVKAAKKHKGCPYCDIINIEKGSFRRCFENESIVAFTPYASRYNYEIAIFPKRHVRELKELNDEELTDLADIMKQTLNKLKELDASFNYYLQYAPAGEDLHFHIEVTPRLATWAGFELCSGAIINSVSPENAAKFYRGEE